MNKTRITQAEAEELVGMCMDCKEYASIASPCCNARLFIEGSTYDPEDFEITDNERKASV